MTNETATHIIFTPFQNEDGRWQPYEEVIERPLGVELDGAWVHVVSYVTPTGTRKRIRSYPARVVECVKWSEPVAAGADS